MVRNRCKAKIILYNLTTKTVLIIKSEFLTETLLLIKTYFRGEPHSMIPTQLITCKNNNARKTGKKLPKPGN